MLGAPVLSFVLPLVKIPSLGQTASQDFMMYFPEAILGSQQMPSQTAANVVSSINYTNVIYGIGAVFFAIVFLVKLAKIIRLIIENEQIDKKFYKLILLSKQSKAFSFFHFIFLGKNIAEDKQEKIIQHELVHSQQKHSIDLLVFEFLRICMWFNPMIYIYQRRITLLHEYISDAEMVKTTEKHDYFNKLLSEAFQVENVSFVNQFYKHSLIKKRITMMKKNKSNPFKKAKYLLLLPLLASMLVYTSCDTNEELVETPLI
uniref:M56 family metallopeptidase n=1 Tax=Polaribacter sp. TaxID=1920175 RepID=UPI004048E8EB